MKPRRSWVSSCVLVVLGACGNERDAARATPVVEQPAPRRSIDVTVTGAPISIRGVELGPVTRMRGVLELGYRVEASDKTIDVPARITCRAGGYNLIYPTGREHKRPGPRLAALYRPDPFTETPTTCEVAFFVGDRQVAAACYRDRVLADGPCPAGTFPPPPRTTAFSVELARAALELHHGSAVVSGVFTLAEPLGPERRFLTQMRCEDPAGTASGEGELAFLPLDDIPVGASVYGPVAIFLDRTADPAARCELRIASRSTTGAPTEQIHARYCLTTGAVQAGECPRS